MPSSGKLLTKLSPEQEALLPAFRDKWTRIGLSTDPTDRRGAEAAIAKVYAAAGLPAPKLIIWLRSPLGGCIGSTFLAQVWAQVGDQVRDQVWAQVRDQVWDQVWDQVGGQVWDQVWAQVRDQVWYQVWIAGYGLHDSEWLGFYDVFSSFGVAGSGLLVGLMDLAKSAGWFWPYQNACILTDRPSELHRDDRGRLHSETGLAIAYPDGWGVYAWHGVRVPKYVIESPESITPDAVFEETNAEVRRVMIERYGRERLLADSRVKLISEAPEHGASYHHIALGDGLKWGFLALRCPTTGKSTVLWSRPDHRDCLAALAASHGLTRAEYAPVVET